MTREILVHIDSELRDELHSQWLNNAFTVELMCLLQKELNEIEDILLGFAANNCQDLTRITNTLNRKLVLTRIANYVRHRKPD